MIRLRDLVSKGYLCTAILVGMVAVISWPIDAAQSKAKKPPKTGKASKKNVEVENIFTNSQILRIQIEIPEASLDTLRNYRWEGRQGSQEKRPSVKATVREGTNTYQDVAIHLKGAAGSFRPIDSEPGLTLNFDKNIKGQKFRALERISLNNSVQDRSLLNEQISRELFARAGIAVPRATQAHVELNGRDLGVYVLVEACNKQFLAQHFKNPNGNLYDGGFLKDITDDLEKSSGSDPTDRSDLRRLAEAALDPNGTNRFARLSQVLDMDRFVTYLALDILMCDWDGYAINRNNYRIYHDPDSDKIVFIPHGLDQMFGVMRVGTDMPIFPRMNGLVARAVMQTTEGRQRYRQALVQLMTNVYQPKEMTNRVWQLAGQIRPLMAARGEGVSRSYDREVAMFCDRIVERAQSIREQLTAPGRDLQFDTASHAVLPEWQSRADFGKPLLEQSVQDGKKVLHLSAGNGSAVGVWYARVRLEPGQYRLEGKVKTKGVATDAGDRRGGAGLRVSGWRFVQKVAGDSAWTDVAFDFEVGGGGGEFGFMGPIQAEAPETELICELRAAKGDAWFDVGSLRLLRK